MAETHIRQVEGDEMLEIFHRANTYAFGPSPPLRDPEEWKNIVRKRKGVDYFALFENEQAVSNAATSEMRQNVRGVLLPAGGVWGVATLPGARRKGYCRKVMETLLKSEYQQGRAVSLLYPFRGSFYERLGYITFPVPRTALFSIKNLAAILKRDFDGEVRIRTIAEAYDDFDRFLNELQTNIHGMARFVNGNREQLIESNRLWIAEALVDGRPLGMMAYDLRGDQIMEFNFRASNFYYKEVQARYLLLQWIAMHVDQASKVEIRLPAAEFPETWLADLRPEMKPAFIAPMGRVVRIEALAGLETGQGCFTVHVEDPMCQENTGNWTFNGESGRLVISKALHAEDRLTIHGLSAAVYGTHDPQVFRYLGWGNITSTIAKKIRTVFPPAIPHVHEMF